MSMTERLCFVAGSDPVAVAERAVEVLRRPGSVVLLPTETVYGLVCRAEDRDAVERIYALKDRDFSKPLSWFVFDWRTLGRFGVILEGLPEKLAEEYCPGPITIIASRTDGTTVGFRIPDHPLVLEILRRIDVPLASTSANLSGRPNALTVGEALAELTGEVDLAIDAGAIPADAQPSTVVLATGKEPKVLRPGPIRFQ